MDSCVTEVNSLLQNSTLPTFTKRVLPVVAVYTAYTVAEWVIAGIVAALGVGTGYAAVKSVNLQDTSDDGVIGQLNSVVNASVIALATGTDHKIMASLTLSNPSPAPTGNVSEVRRIREGPLITYLQRHSKKHADVFPESSCGNCYTRHCGLQKG